MNNFDPLETKKFSDLSLCWWDPEGPCKPLHKMGPLRLQAIIEQVPISGKKIIDIGCGGGLLTEDLVQCGACVTGIDNSSELISVAKQHAYCNNLSIHYEINTAENKAQEQAKSYDIVCCMELLEHVPDPYSVIRACAQLVKPEGWVFFSTLHRTFKSYLLAILAAEYVFNLLPRGTHHFARFIKPSELAKAARDNKLMPICIKGIGYNPVNEQVSFNLDVSVNYIIACQCIT